MTTPASRLAALLLAASTLGPLGGCKLTGSQDRALAASSPATREGLSISVATDSVNYMHERAVQYTLHDLSKNPPSPVGGAIVRMLATGGEKGCCVDLPQQWRPGLKVRVDWDEGDRERIYPEKYSKVLEIPRYDQPGDVYVVFYPNHEVEVVASVGEPGQANWAGRIKETPWDHCLANHERKVCKAALPKQFDVKSSQGSCVYAMSKEYPGTAEEAHENCAFERYQCLQDYEDENFCDLVLWGEKKK